MGTAAQVYAQELEVLNLGHPMWYPEPADQYEVRIGDVGFFDEDGQFHRLFNATVGENHPYNQNGVPEGFHPVSVEKSLIQIRRNHLPSGPISSRSVKSHKVDASASVNVAASVNGQLSYRFECSTSQGAVLVLKDPAKKTYLLPSRTIQSYVVKNHLSWHRFATQRFDLLLDPEDIIMVRATVKTTGWALGVFLDNGDTVHDVSFAAQAGSLGEATFEWSFTKQISTQFQHRVAGFVEPSLTVSLHPSPEDSQGTTKLELLPEIIAERQRDDDNASIRAENKDNQCVFLSFYKVKYNKLHFLKKIEAAAGPDNLPPPESHDLLDYILETSHALVAIASDHEVAGLLQVRHIPFRAFFLSYYLAGQNLVGTLYLEELHGQSASVELAGSSATSRFESAPFPSVNASGGSGPLSESPGPASSQESIHDDMSITESTTPPIASSSISPTPANRYEARPSYHGTEQVEQFSFAEDPSYDKLTWRSLLSFKIPKAIKRDRDLRSVSPQSLPPTTSPLSTIVSQQSSSRVGLPTSSPPNLSPFFRNRYGTTSTLEVPHNGLEVSRIIPHSFSRILHDQPQLIAEQPSIAELLWLYDRDSRSVFLSSFPPIVSSPASQFLRSSRHISIPTLSPPFPSTFSRDRYETRLTSEVYYNGSGGSRIIPRSFIRGFQPQQIAERSSSRGRYPTTSTLEVPHNGLEVPQSIPYTFSHDLYDQPQLIATFSCDGREGIHMDRAVHGDVSDIDDPFDNILPADLASWPQYHLFVSQPDSSRLHAASMTVFTGQWPGYEPYSREGPPPPEERASPSKTPERARSLSRAEVACQIAEVVQDFIETAASTGAHSPSNPWMVGSNGIQLENLELVGLKRISDASFQPVLRYYQVGLTAVPGTSSQLR
ncbi:hypothetical protein EIP86_000052 [Pleurotus ostreatoroseus]|nr:hypothetical protein EIP86_000052 [Pleurotus ostreatoroseus]